MGGIVVDFKDISRSAICSFDRPKIVTTGDTLFDFLYRYDIHKKTKCPIFN